MNPELLLAFHKYGFNSLCFEIKIINKDQKTTVERQETYLPLYNNLLKTV